MSTEARELHRIISASVRDMLGRRPHPGAGGAGKSPAVLRRAVRAVADTMPNARHQALKGQTHHVSTKVLAPVLEEFFACGCFVLDQLGEITGQRGCEVAFMDSITFPEALSGPTL